MDGMRPCPLCGSEEIKVYVTGAQGAYRRGVVKCLGCGCRVEAESGGYHDYPHDDPRETYDMANFDARSGVIEKWNRRAERTCRMVDCGSHDTCVVNRELINGNIVSMGFGYKQCSECGANVFDCPTVRYCPSCGARVVTADADR